MWQRSATTRSYGEKCMHEGDDNGKDIFYLGVCTALYGIRPSLKPQKVPKLFSDDSRLKAES
eukprot:scaffold45691_cov74-Cyclotella_meneghiniana.AAC.8